MTYPVLGPIHFGRDPAIEPVGAVTFYERRDTDGTRHVGAVRIDPITVIDSVLLGWARCGAILGVTVTDDQLILELENGHWEYRLGDYNPRHQGILLYLTDGEPLTP